MGRAGPLRGSMLQELVSWPIPSVLNLTPSILFLQPAPAPTPVLLWLVVSLGGWPCPNGQTTLARSGPHTLLDCHLGCPKHCPTARLEPPSLTKLYLKVSGKFSLLNDWAWDLLGVQVCSTGLTFPASLTVADTTNQTPLYFPMSPKHLQRGAFTATANPLDPAWSRPMSLRLYLPSRKGGK